jgi:hypothetical protein
MTRILILISSFLFSAAVLTACVGTNESPPSSAQTSPNAGQTSMTGAPSALNSPAAQADSQIVISNMAYAVPTSVRPGQQLTIVN